MSAFGLWAITSALAGPHVHDLGLHFEMLGHTTLYFAGGLCLGYGWFTRRWIPQPAILTVAGIFVAVVLIVAVVESSSDHLVSLFRDRNFLAFSSAMVLLLTYYHQSKGLTVSVLRIMLVGIILGTASVSGLIFVLMIASWRYIEKIRGAADRRSKLKTRFVVGIGAGIMGTAILYSPAIDRAEQFVVLLTEGSQELHAMSSAARRENLLYEGARIISENVWTGVGYGTVPNVVRIRHEGEGYTLHNTFLEIWASAGAVPFMIFLCSVVCVFTKAWRGRHNRVNRFCLTGMLVCTAFAMTYTVYHRMAPVTFFAFFVYAIMRRGRLE